MIPKIKKNFQSAYKDAQSLAITCSAANNIYRQNSLKMVLPDVILILDFSSGEMNVRWILEKNQQENESDPDSEKCLNQSEVNEKKKTQLLRNTTILKIVTTDDFEPEYCEAVHNFVGSRTFKRIIVKGFEYTENLKMMVEMFDKEVVEIEVNALTDDFIPFPDVSCT